MCPTLGDYLRCFQAALRHTQVTRAIKLGVTFISSGVDQAYLAAEARIKYGEQLEETIFRLSCGSQ